MNFPDIGYQFLLPALEFFAKATNSYGWSIILLTLAVRIIVWPLVSKSTQSMQRMAKLQPELNALKERYKAEPEVFQKKSMEFFAKNKVNPMGGCWPLLIQMPILIALYSTFSGPPFGDKAIDVKVNVVEGKQAAKIEQAPASNNNSSYVSLSGKQAKIVVFPGESTIAAGETITFGVRAAEGELSKDFVPTWKIIAPGNKGPEDPGVTAEAAAIDAKGEATFMKPGEYHVQALIPGIAKNDRFLLINGLGKVARGLELLKPQNWDSLVLIVLFGATMFLSQKFTVTTPKPAPGVELDEQQLIQQQTMKTMPIVTTVMFMFIPLPAGVLLYLVISNVFQTLQTALLMKMPTPALVSVTGDPGPAPDGGDKPGKKKIENQKTSNGKGNAGPVIENKERTTSGAGKSIIKSSNSGKAKRKKS